MDGRRDGRTEGRTGEHRIRVKRRLCIASRGKKRCLSVNSPELFFGLLRVRVKVMVRIRVRVRVRIRVRVGVRVRVNSVTETNIMTEK